MISEAGGICSAATLVTYGAARVVHQRFPRRWLAPVLVTPALLGIGLWLAGMPALDYYRLTSWLLWFLGPATVAFALPIYQQREWLRRYPISITAGVVSGVALGVASSWLVGHLFQLSPELSRSMLLRSISTPFALAAAHTTGASMNLTALVVLLTGFLGMILGEFVLLWVRPQSPLARGALWGAASHAFGTARAHQLDHQAGAISSLIMILAGILLVLLAPWLAFLR
jgi:putative effector of murein hydrolase